MLTASQARRAMLLVLAALLLQSLAMPARAETSGSGNHLECVSSDYTKITGVVDAGIITMCVSAPTSVRTGENFTVAVSIDGPGPVLSLAGITVVTITADVVNPYGCFTDDGAINSIPMFTDTFGGLASQGFTHNHMKDKECDFAVRGDAQISVAGVLNFRRRLTVAVNINEATCGQPAVSRECQYDLTHVDAENRLCDESLFTQACNQLSFNSDNLNRLCAASAIGAACTTPTINAAVTGTLTVTNTGGQTMTVSGNLDVLARFCAASAVGTTCSTPTLNVVNSGTQHLIVDSWPGLTGTVNVVNSGGQTMTVSGTLDNLDRLCAASATGTACTTPTVNLAGAVTVHNDGTLTVTNTGGQTMTLAGAATIHADGSLTVTNAGGQALSFTGPLTVHQDPICTASSHCFQDISGLTINQTMGNVSVVIPSNTTTHLCGPATNVSSCPPVASASLVTLPVGDYWLPVFLWAFGLILFLRLGKLMAAGACTVGIVVSLLQGLPANAQAFPILLLGVCLWLEATMRERIYQRWFKPAKAEVV